MEGDNGSHRDFNVVGGITPFQAAGLAGLGFKDNSVEVSEWERARKVTQEDDWWT